MAFKAQKVAAELAWDFRPYVDAHGVTPEPHEEAVTDFQHAMQQASAALLPEDVDLNDTAAMLRAMSELSREDYRQMQEATLDALADLTDGSPTRAQIEALPYRIQRAYIDSISGELLDPTGEKNATKPSPGARRRG